VSGTALVLAIKTITSIRKIMRMIEIATMSGMMALTQCFRTPRAMASKEIVAPNWAIPVKSP
jgi:hypothetical protein